MKKLNITLLLLGLGFLAYLVWHVGPRQLWGPISALGWGIIPIILCEGIANVAHTVGWRHCLSASQPPVPLMRLFRIAMAGYSINYLTPSASVGGEASKVALLAGSHPPSETVNSVLLDKLTTAIAHLLLVVLGALILLWQGTLPGRWWGVMAVLTALVAGGMAIFLWLQRQGKLGGLLRWLADRRLGGQAVAEAARQISTVDDALKRFHRERPRDLVLSIGWHVLGHSAAFLHVWIFLVLLQQPAPLAAVAVAGFLSLWCDLLTFAIPLNLGALEGSRILALKFVGNQVALGMAFGVAIRIAQLSWACFGLASYALLTVRQEARTPAPLSQDRAVPPTDPSPA